MQDIFFFKLTSQIHEGHEPVFTYRACNQTLLSPLLFLKWTPSENMNRRTSNPISQKDSRFLPWSLLRDSGSPQKRVNWSYLCFWLLEADKANLSGFKVKKSLCI